MPFRWEGTEIIKNHGVVVHMREKRVSRGRWRIVTLTHLVTLGLRVRCPEREIVAQQLHDQRAILVRVLVERVELGDRVVECLQNVRDKAFSMFATQKSAPVWQDCTPDRERSISRSRTR